MLVEEQLEAMLAIEASMEDKVASILSSIIEDYISAAAGSNPLGSDSEARLGEALTSIWQASINQGVLIKNAEQYLADFQNTFGQSKLRLITNNLRNDIIRRIDAGSSLEEVVETIRSTIPEISQGRAKTIVMTETHSAFQYAGYRRALASGDPVRKRWNTVLDGRARGFDAAFNHQVMDGVTIPLNNMFQVPSNLGGVEAIMFPGDPNGSAGNIINCRCVQTFVT